MFNNKRMISLEIIFSLPAAVASQPLQDWLCGFTGIYTYET